MNGSGMVAAEFAWTVPADHPAFAGHFPGRPIVPGVVLLDRAIVFAERLLVRPVAGWQVGNAKFLVPVGPGAVLVFAFAAGRTGGLVFRVHAGDREVASGSLAPAP
jgi:3-hydroxymyristoyl/3-hydroxydecanoyl-(acyl carrier protein) dehydratase